MRACWRTILITSSLAAAIGAGASTLQADGHGNRYAYGHSYGGHRYSHGPGYGYGLGWGYAPGYGYGLGWGIGYGYSGGPGSSFGLSFSAPLYIGPSYYYPRPATVLVPRAVGVYQPPGVTATEPVCQQTREYQTEITIGDQVLPAYGTACLQADGSWKIISGPILAE